MARKRDISAFAQQQLFEDDILREKLRPTIEQLVEQIVSQGNNITTDAATPKQKGEPQLSAANQATIDSFQNFAAKLGIGADNMLSSASYGFNPITRTRTLLEWIHRGSFIGGVAVDAHADDMTREGIELKGLVDPKHIEKISEEAVNLKIWSSLRDTVAWSRLYGGSIAVLLIDGHDMKQPLNVERIDKGQFKGLLVLDRWMVEPSLNDLVTEYGPDLGLPKYYTVTADAPALPRMKIHHSRCVRLEGIRLPYMQRIMENLWGISIYERVYDRMVAFDSATTGSAQLVYKAYIRTYKVKDLRQVIAAGGQALNGVTRYVEFMRRFQGIEGMTLMDTEDEFEAQSHQAFSGLSDTLAQFAQQVSGALQIPLVRLFGQSPAGFSTGDTDLRNYYDSIRQQQERELRVGVMKIYRAIAKSLGINLPEGFNIAFKSLWQLSETDKANIANQVTSAVIQAEGAGLVSQQVALKELRQSAEVSGVWSNISDEDIEAASAELPPAGEEAFGQTNEGGEAAGGEADGTEKPEASGQPKDTQNAGGERKTNEHGDQQ